LRITAAASGFIQVAGRTAWQIDLPSASSWPAFDVFGNATALKSSSRIGHLVHSASWTSIPAHRLKDAEYLAAIAGDKATDLAFKDTIPLTKEKVIAA